LDPEQLEALDLLVEGSRNVRRDEREPFYYKHVVNERRAVVEHPAFPDGELILFSDLEILATAGLVSLTYEEHRCGTLYVTPAGFRFYDEHRRNIAAPVEAVENYVHTYLSAARFTTTFPAAYGRWLQADRLLSSADSAAQFSVIGHLCREAMQEFAHVLAASESSIERVATDKSQTISRVRSAIESVKSSTTREFLNALLAYWGTVHDLVQRQEHAAQKDKDDLTWEDTRRVVFHTAVVMFEISRAVRYESAG
jgi:hypothetical protein